MRRARGAFGPVAAGVLVAAYAAALRRYGVFDPADEGLLLVQGLRAAAGQLPYTDFHTGYGPLYFQLQGALVAAGGLAAVRWALVAVHGATAGLCYALTRRLAGAPAAAVAVALEVAFFLPLAPGRGAPFNAPYPAWYAGLAGVALAILLGRSPRAARAALAGVVAGLVFAIKPNSGLLLAAGAAAALVLGDGHGPGAGWLGIATLAAVALAAVGIVAPTGVTIAALVLAPPALALAALGAARGDDDATVLGRLAALGTGFAATAAVCYGPTLARLGVAGFAHDVLLVGAGVAEVYGLPFPWPALLAAVVGALAFFGHRRPAPALGAAALLAVVVAFVAGALAGARLSALRLGGEQVAFALVPLALWGALAVARRVGGGPLGAATAVAVPASLQLYPRPDLLHLMPLAPLLLPLALRLWRAAVARAPVRPRAAPALLVGLPLAVAATRAAPALDVLARLAAGHVATVPVGSVRLVVDEAGRAPLEALAAIVTAVEAGSRPGERVLVFPACGLVPFFAGRLPAGPHDYFFPGRPARAEAAALAERLASAPPALAVTCSAADTPLAEAWTYYPEVVALLAGRYRETLARPPYTIGARRD